METPKPSQLFSKAISSIFGNPAPLENQDTIDYSKTIDFKNYTNSYGNANASNTTKSNIGNINLSLDHNNFHSCQYRRPLSNRFDSIGDSAISTPRVNKKLYSRGVNILDDDNYKVSNDHYDFDPKNYGADDIFKRKSVAWGENQFKDRTRSSDIPSSLSPPINIDKYTNSIDRKTLYNRDFLKSNMLDDDCDDNTKDILRSKINDINDSFDMKERKDVLTGSRSGLPINYPGKFPSPFKSRYHNIDDKLRHKDYEFLEFKPDILGSKDSIANKNHELMEQIAKQRHENEELLLKRAETNTYLNNVLESEDNDLDYMINKIEENNNHLKKIIDDVEKSFNADKELGSLNLNKEYDHLEGVSSIKYNKLRNEYIREMKNCERFYEAYFNLIQKYRILKHEFRHLQTKSPPSLTRFSNNKGEDELRTIELMDKVSMLKAIKKQLETKNFELRDENYELKNLKSKMDLELNKMTVKVSELNEQLDNRNNHNNGDSELNYRVKKLEKENTILQDENYRIKEQHELEVLQYERKIRDLEKQLHRI